jgi:hypothetical protein
MVESFNGGTSEVWQTECDTDEHGMQHLILVEPAALYAHDKEIGPHGRSYFPCKNGAFAFWSQSRKHFLRNIRGMFRDDWKQEIFQEMG